MPGIADAECDGILTLHGVKKSPPKIVVKAAATMVVTRFVADTDLFATGGGDASYERERNDQ